MGLVIIISLSFARGTGNILNYGLWFSKTTEFTVGVSDAGSKTFEI